MTIHSPIAAISSPSSTDELALDILAASAESRLVGALTFFELMQEGRRVRATGQITSMEMRNKFHENDVYKNIIKTKGRIPHLSGREDVRTARLAPGAVFGHDGVSWVHEILGTVPAAGTPTYKLTQAVLDELVAPYASDLFYLGRAYGDDAITLPMYAKHFGNPKTGGAGEAYHSMTVGKTGSGKSTVVKFKIAGWARHQELAMLIIDPKGEFSDEISGYGVGDSGLPFSNILKGLGRVTKRYGITQVRLEGYELFEDVLISLGLGGDLNIRGADNKIELATAFSEIIRANNALTLDALRGDDRGQTSLRTILETIVHEEDGYVDRIYKSKEPQDSLKKIIERILGSETHRIWKTWDFLSFLFEDDGRRQTIGQIVRYVMASDAPGRPIVSLDLSVTGNRRDLVDLGAEFETLRAADEERDLFTDALQKKIMFRITADMRRLCESICSERIRAGSKQNVNTLVILEEAHRTVPQHVAADDEDGKKLKAKFVECVRETRKYGLGFEFIDQTIGGIDREIVQQVRCFFVGYGLSMGSELQAVRELIGGDPGDIGLYRSFKDPASYGSPEQKRFPWMAFGPVSPLVSNRPLFFNAFGAGEFKDRNRLPDAGHAILRLPPQIASRTSRRQSVQGNVDITSISLLDDGILDD